MLCMSHANRSGILNKGIVMTRLFTCGLFGGVMLMAGCISAPRDVTLEDELVQAFGSYENACEATMTIIPNLYRTASPVELSREDRLQVLETLRRCIRYYDGTEEEVEDLKRRGLGGYLSAVDNKIKISSTEREFFVYFTDIGFLCSYLCPTPDLVPEVNFILKCCMAECVKRHEESAKDGR